MPSTEKTPSTPEARASASDWSLPELYDEYAPFVFRILRRMGFSGAALEDAVQDVFFVAHRRIVGFDGRSPQAWLSAIARRVASDARRREKRHELCHRESEHGRAIEAESFRRAPEQGGPHVAADLVYHLLDALDTDRREVFILAELEGMSMPEVSQALEVNLNTAYARLRAARSQVRAQYARLLAHEKWWAP